MTFLFQSKTVIAGDYHASPADNDTSRDLTWRDKSVTLKEKGQTRPYDIRSKSPLQMHYVIVQ